MKTVATIDKEGNFTGLWGRQFNVYWSKTRFGWPENTCELQQTAKKTLGRIQGKETRTDG